MCHTAREQGSRTRGSGCSALTSGEKCRARGDRSVKRRRKQQRCDGEGRVLGKWPVIPPAMKSAFKRKDLRMCTSRYSESVFHSPLRMIIVRSCYASFCKGSILVQGSLTDCKCPCTSPRLAEAVPRRRKSVLSNREGGA